MQGNLEVTSGPEAGSPEETVSLRDCIMTNSLIKMLFMGNARRFQYLMGICFDKCIVFNGVVPG